MSRAIRRHHYRRLLKSREHYWNGPTLNPRHRGIKVSAAKPKQCTCCRNPRPIEGPTRAERLHQRSLEEQLHGPG